MSFRMLLFATAIFADNQKVLNYQCFFALSTVLLHHYYTNEPCCDKIGGAEALCFGSTYY